MNKHILMIAGSDIDSFYQIEAFPGAGDVTMAKPLGEKVGGCVLNVAAVSASLGSDVKVLDYLKAEDEKTLWLVEELKKKKVDVSNLQYGHDVVNGHCLIMQCLDEKCIFVIEPVRPFFKVDKKMQDLLDNSSFIYSLMHTLTLSFEQLDCLRQAKEKGAKLIFDGASQYSKVEEARMLAALADGLFLNKQSYQRLCNSLGYDGRELLENQMDFICVTDGANGATCYTKDSEHCFKALAVEVVDSTGAGDAFAGCFLHFLNKGYDYESCLKLATVNGGYACTVRGGNSGTLSEQELFEFARKNNIEVER